MPLNSVEGTYFPSFFSIILETNEDISLAISKNESTFLHEFIHYLQDLILPYNIRVNLSNIRWFLNIHEYAVSHGYIKRPFKEWNDESNITKLQYQYTMGSNQLIEDVKNIGEPIVSSIEKDGFDASFSNKYRKFNIYKYRIPINNDSEFYDLGARDLLEYIAHKIEVHHYPSSDHVPQLPYQSIDLLFDKYGLSFIPENIRLCIVECCLYNDNPVHFLFSQFLENCYFTTTLALLNCNYTAIYNFLLSITFETKDHVKETLSHKRNRRLEHLKNDLMINYSYFPEIVDWISKVNRFSVESLSERFLFSDMYNMSKTELKDFIKEVVSAIGIPLVMNKRGQYTSVPAGREKESVINQFIQFYILQEFLAFVELKSKSCPIRKFCKANYGLECRAIQIFDKQKRITQIEKCPLIEFLQPYGLSDIQYK